MLESPNNLGPRVRYRARRSAPWTSSVGTVCSPCTENPEWTHLTHDKAQLLALSGPRNPYPGKLGVVETDALADLLLRNSDGAQTAHLDERLRHRAGLWRTGRAARQGVLRAEPPA